MPLTESRVLSDRSVDLDAMFSGLVRQSSEGQETIDYLSAVSAFGRCVAAGPDLAVLLHDACELAALVAQADMLVIAQLTEDGKKLWLQVASFHQGREVVVEKPDPILVEPALSMAAFAMNLADVVESENIVAERRFSDLLLRREQMGSGVFVPLCSRNRAFGALGLARKQPSSFTPDETHFATGISQLLASYLAQTEAEEQLRRGEAISKATRDSVDTPILTLDEHGVVCQMNAAAMRISGFRDREIRDRPFWIALIAPEDTERVAKFFRQGGTEDGGKFKAVLMSKEGRHRAFAWSLCVVEAAEGTGRTYVLSGLDQTELQERCMEVEKYQRIFQGAAEARVQSPEDSDWDQDLLEPTGAEKRSSPRREFNYYQRIAPIIDDSLPGEGEFKRVVCRDISAGGFSFVASEPPTYDELIISLGSPPRDRKIVAKVVRVVKKEIDGRDSHLVGCQFIGRLSD